MIWAACGQPMPAAGAVRMLRRSRRPCPVPSWVQAASAKPLSGPASAACDGGEQGGLVALDDHQVVGRACLRPGGGRFPPACAERPRSRRSRSGPGARWRARAQGSRWSWRRFPAGRARARWSRRRRTAGAPGCRQGGRRRGRSCRPRRPAGSSPASGAGGGLGGAALLPLVHGSRPAGRPAGWRAARPGSRTAAALNASASMRSKTRENVRTLGGRIRRVHGSRRPPRRASVSCEQPAAHSAIASGESCPAAVNAQTASPSTNSSWCHRPSRERGSGTRASHSAGSAATHQRRREPGQLRRPERRSGKIAIRARSLRRSIQVGTFDLGKPCPPVKPGTRPRTRHTGPTGESRHQPGHRHQPCRVNGAAPVPGRPAYPDAFGRTSGSGGGTSRCPGRSGRNRLEPRLRAGNVPLIWDPVPPSRSACGQPCWFAIRALAGLGEDLVHRKQRVCISATAALADVLLCGCTLAQLRPRCLAARARLPQRLAVRDRPSGLGLWRSGPPHRRPRMT